MEQIKKTIDYINLKTNNFKPEIGIILGSGLGCFCDNLDGYRLKYSEIPNFNNVDVKGHKGELLFCEIENKKVAIMQGRFHFYEGNSMQESTFPIKVLKFLGIKTLIITNAAGATSKELEIGDVMLIKDHINFMGDNPLIGKNNELLGERFPDMSNIYDKDLRNLTKQCANEINLPIKEGVYIGTTGPSYETAAEIRAFKILGADAVGMSTVPEAIVANYLKIKTVGLSTISNYATGVSETKLTHKEVIEIGSKTSKKLVSLIGKLISKL